MYYSQDDLIEKLNLSARSSNVLHRAGITTLGQLFNLDNLALRNIKSLGSRSIEEILIKCQSISLYDVDDSKQEPSASKSIKIFCGADGIEYQDIPIESLELSSRSCNCLKRAGVSMLSELIRLSESELMKLPQMGAKSVAEIMNLKASSVLIPADESSKGGFYNEPEPQARVKGQNKCVVKELYGALGISPGELFAEITLYLEDYWSEYNPSNSQNLLEDEHICL